MRPRTILALAGIAAGVAVPCAGAANRSPQTHPAMIPSSGAPRTSFSVHYTQAVAPGHAGVTQTSYAITVTVPRHGSPRRCAPPSPPAAPGTGSAGQRVTVRLATPVRGWCLGTYTVTIELERGPYCPPPADGGPPQMCPLFATRAEPVGTTHFTVRPGSADPGAP